MYSPKLRIFCPPKPRTKSPPMEGPTHMLEPGPPVTLLRYWMYRGQFFTEYRVIRRFFAKSGYRYRVVDCLSKHAQHKLNGCRRKCTAYSDHRSLSINRNL